MVAALFTFFFGGSVLFASTAGLGCGVGATLGCVFWFQELSTGDALAFCSLLEQPSSAIANPMASTAERTIVAGMLKPSTRPVAPSTFPSFLGLFDFICVMFLTSAACAVALCYGKRVAGKQCVDSQ